jgi:hypothetical protein
MTVIGFEQLVDGSKYLLVFDPKFSVSSPILQWATRETRPSKCHPTKHLQPYRKGVKYLKNFSEFEVLRLARFSTDSNVRGTDIISLTPP